MAPHPHPARRRSLAVLAAVVAAFLVLGDAAWAAKRFRFNGAGRGHGIGMGQWGAYGLARSGWSGGRIVRHFYTGVALRERRPPKTVFRVGLLQNRGSIQAVARSGQYVLRLRSGTLIEIVAEGARRRIAVTAEKRYVIRRPNGTVVGRRRWGGPRNPLEIRRKDGGRIRIPEWGHAAGRGFLRYRISGPGRGHLVAVVSPEAYLFGVSEVSSTWPIEAQRAQALAARTYAYRVVASGARSGCDCDILGDTRDQLYVGWSKESATGGRRWRKAVRSTRRKVAVSGGRPIYTYYHASSGGYTEHIENVWSGAAPQPYLKGVCDPGDYVRANPDRVWGVALTGGEVAARLGNPGGMRRATRVAVLRRGVSGRVVRARVVGRRSDGSVVRATYSGWHLRGALGLAETRFWVNADRNVTGAIRRRYDRLNCRPGLATTNQKSINGGRWQGFRRGRMYLNADRSRVVWLRGRVLKKYRSLGAHGSRLSLPVRDPFRLADGRTRGRFEGGAITCRPGGGCRVVYS